MNIRRIVDELRLQATGEGVKIVGFTSLDTSETDSLRWHRISSLAPSPTSMFEMRRQPRRGTDPPSPGRHITVAAVVCLGGDGPTTVTHNFAATKKFRDVARSGRAAIVIDDVLPPWQPRGIEIRGSAEAVGGDNPRIRIRPERIIAWGIEGSAGAAT